MDEEVQDGDMSSIEQIEKKQCYLLSNRVH